MLVLSRDWNESVMIGDDIEITVLEVRQNRIRLGIDAPRELPVHRKEVWLEIQQRKFNAEEARKMEDRSIEHAQRLLDKLESMPDAEEGKA